ncbi:MAG: hypothetical protein LH647_15165, partial [Leptolyngbyaceae cyanobacterium CAN_BIN12]|nr:hypothetical protein [Leptolyngbyaceae cyanobacterium CAN_BIN12]
MELLKRLHRFLKRVLNTSKYKAEKSAILPRIPYVIAVGDHGILAIAGGIMGSVKAKSQILLILAVVLRSSRCNSSHGSLPPSLSLMIKQRVKYTLTSSLTAQKRGEQGLS